MGILLKFGFLLSLCGIALATEKGGCPFKDSEKFKSEEPKGQHQPYGYHAKTWKRIETLYEHPSPEDFYRKYMRASVPVVIRGGAKNWPALKKWTNLTYLNEKADRGRPIIQWKKMYSYDPYHPVRVKMTMKEFTKDFDKYNLYMDSTLPTEIAKDVHWPDSLGCRFYLKRTKQVAIMFNNGKSSSDLHMDATCTYFVQVTGSRRWLLSPPTEVMNTYSGAPNLIDHNGISSVNQTNVDMEKHYLLNNLTIYAAVMDPGDIIYVPEGWHHQVKTYNSPNIGIVMFMNYLFCELHSNPDDDDVAHVKKCVYKIREQRPKDLRCEAFPEKDMTIPELIKKYKPSKPSTFMNPFERGGGLGFLSLMRILNNGKRIQPMGISLRGQDATKKEVLSMALLEGFRMYCLSTRDKKSAHLLSNIMKRHRQLRKLLTTIVYLPKPDFGSERAQKAIDNVIKNLNVTKINMLLLQTDYCPAKNGDSPCERNVITEEMKETWRAMEKAHRDGKVETLGVSDFSLNELKKFMKFVKVPISIARARFDPWFRNKEYRKFCRKNRIAFMGRNVLGGQWKKDVPNYPGNRDITQEYYIRRASFQYKTSVHGVTYDWATRKAVIICPPMDDPLHVRVNGNAFRSESPDNPDNLQNIDEHTDADGSDQGLFSPSLKNHLSEREDERGPVDVGDEKFVYNSDLQNSFDEQYSTMTATEKDFSQEVYTDQKDFEKFPAYMGIKSPDNI